MKRDELEACIIQFGRWVFANGGIACDKTTKRELWRKATGRKLAAKAADRAVERVCRHPVFLATLEDLGASGQMQAAVQSALAARHAPVVRHDAETRRVVLDRADWLARLYAMADGAEKEEVRLKALDMIGRAEGHYAPVQANIGIQADLAVVLAALRPAPLVRDDSLTLSDD